MKMNTKTVKSLARDEWFYQDPELQSHSGLGSPFIRKKSPLKSPVDSIRRAEVSGGGCIWATKKSGCECVTPQPGSESKVKTGLWLPG